MHSSVSSKELVAVVVPVYQSELSLYDTFSLRQCLQVLGHYPIIVVKPESLNLDHWLTYSKNIIFENFAHDYFKGIQAYNRLMLSEEFYQRFTKYEFILLHQLDAFVFEDKLTEWCQKGYDYIGAPWLKDLDFQNNTEEVLFNIKKKIALWLDLKKADGITPREIITINSVGNGGFSLRRIDKFLAVLQQRQPKVQAYLNQTAYQFNEDVFWGIEVNRFSQALHIPDWRTALGFAFEFFPEKAYRFNHQQLPFGCHAFDVHGTAFWKPFFSALGYEL